MCYIERVASFSSHDDRFCTSCGRVQYAPPYYRQWPSTIDDFVETKTMLDEKLPFLKESHSEKAMILMSSLT